MDPSHVLLAMGLDDKAAFSAIQNQYERALWLYLNATALFEDALNARQADVFRQSAFCYSGYVAPRDLTVLASATRRPAPQGTPGSSPN